MNQFFTSLLKSKKVFSLLIIIGIMLVGYIAWVSINTTRTKSSSETYIEHQQKFTENNPLVKHIPYKTPFYSISYDTVGDSIEIKVFTPSPHYRYEALQYMMFYDQEVTLKYNIVFVDFTSPLVDKEVTNA